MVVNNFITDPSIQLTVRNVKSGQNQIHISMAYNTFNLSLHPTYWSVLNVTNYVLLVTCVSLDSCFTVPTNLKNSSTLNNPKTKNYQKKNFEGRFREYDVSLQVSRDRIQLPQCVHTQAVNITLTFMFFTYGS